jgi:hypothetical protein
MSGPKISFGVGILAILLLIALDSYIFGVVSTLYIVRLTMV